MKIIHRFRCDIQQAASGQTWRIMKLIIVIMTLFLIQASAKTSAQQLTIKKNNITLREIFTQIRKQTGYTVIATTELVNKTKPFDLNIENAALGDVLKQILEERNLEYSIKGKSISISERGQPTLIDKIINLFDNIDINGKVTDEQNQPLPGATIKIKGTNQTYTTDQNGNFYLQNVDEKAILVISYIGYGEKEIKAEKNPTITLKMISGDLNQVEVVNKGYYTQKKELLTGSVTTVTAKEIEKQPVSNPLAALAGRVPGLEMQQLTGLPGSKFKINIRGQNSLRNGSNPLFVIDNVPMVSSSIYEPVTVSGGVDIFNSINPTDIESIEVLTDADATAIYGSRGANGVILITTKKGKAGATRISVDGSSGWAKPTDNLHLLNTEQYLEMRKEAYKNDGLPIPDASIPADQKNASNYDLTVWDQNRYTDWQKVLIGDAARYSDANINLSGGNGNTQFSLGSNYHRETPTIPGDFAYQRGNFRINLDHHSMDNRFSAQASAFYSANINRRPDASIVQSIFLAPNAPAIYNADGSLNWENSTWTNPLSQLEIINKSKMNTLNGNLSLTYEFIEGLKLKVAAGFGNSIGKDVRTTPKSSFDPANTSAQSSAQYGDQSLSSWNIEPQLNFRKTVGNHHFDALAGLTFNEQEYSTLSQFGVGYSNDALLESRQAASTLYQSDYSYSLYRYTSVYARIGYDYHEKYVLNLTARRDGSSRFGPGKKFGNFGAIGAAWLFSKEDFISKTLPFLSTGKLRASYGITGNDQIGDYQYLNVYNPRGAAFQGVTPLFNGGVINPDYAWETTKKAEIGLELGFFADRINIGATYYQNRSSNQLTLYPLPAVTGSAGVTSNSRAVIQNSGLELALHTTNIQSGKFSWMTDINFSLPRNKLVSYPDLANSPYLTTYIEGKTISLNNTYKFTGVDPNTGLYSVLDYNNDGLISYGVDDKNIIELQKRFYGGVQNTFRMGQFELGFLFQFVKGNQMLNYYRLLLAGTAGYSGLNMPDFVLNRWQKPGDVTDVQRYSTGTGETFTSLVNGISSDLGYSDASYIRLRNLYFSYELPSNWKTALKASSASVFVQGQNLLTFTDYLGLDPETSGNIAPNRVITIGGRLSF